MKLIVGLGNPGKEYAGTRHNAGFFAADELAKKLGAVFSINKKFNAELAETKNGRTKIFLLKPLTFMNRSGDAINAAIKYYKIKKTDILIMHDDKDIPIGQYRLQTNRGSAGHKGVESAIECLKTKNFTRLRIGVKAIKPIKDTADFVLGRFTKTEENLLRLSVDSALQEIFSAY